MCGRAKLSTPGDELAEALGLVEVPELEPRYNIAPTQPIPIVKAESPRIELVRWGLIPWFTPQKPLPDPAGAGMPQAINGRAESIASKRLFADAFRRRRCVVVIDGFYEWQKQGRAKRPHHIRRSDGAPLPLAGVWDRWVTADGEVVESCAIVTVEAREPVRTIHDRMPAILGDEARAIWLDPSRAEPDLHAVLKHPPPDLVMNAVSMFVNNPAHEGPECVRPDGGTALSLF